MKISPVGAQLLHAVGRANGQTDVKKLTVAFRSFVKAPKREQVLCRVQVGNCLRAHLRRIIDNTSNARYIGSNVCEYEYARRMRGDTT
jgi:hypothetical protein